MSREDPKERTELSLPKILCARAPVKCPSSSSYPLVTLTPLTFSNIYRQNRQQSQLLPVYGIKTEGHKKKKKENRQKNVIFVFFRHFLKRKKNYNKRSEYHGTYIRWLLKICSARMEENRYLSEKKNPIYDCSRSNQIQMP